MAIGLFTHQAYLVVCSPQVVDHCPFILALFPTPGAVGEAGKMPEASGSWIPTSPKTLGDSEVGTALRNFKPLGRDCKV